MSSKRSIRLVATALLLSPLYMSSANAQFGTGIPGLQSLPQYDFTWTWGDPSRARQTDFSMIGNEGGFRCDLSGKLRFTGRVSRSDVRELEDNIRSSLYFIRSSTNAMNILDARGELEWASLECAKPQAELDADEEARAQREARALERAARERERRRARRAREEARSSDQ